MTVGNARLGGLATAAARTPQERSEAARKAVEARWAKVNALRAAEGLPLTKPDPPVLDDETKQAYLAIVDEKFGVDYPWPSAAARSRQAVALARADAARLAAEAFGR